MFVWFKWFDDQPFDEWEIVFSGVFEALSCRIFNCVSMCQQSLARYCIGHNYRFDFSL